MLSKPIPSRAMIRSLCPAAITGSVTLAQFVMIASALTAAAASDSASRRIGQNEFGARFAENLPLDAHVGPSVVGQQDFFIVQHFCFQRPRLTYHARLDEQQPRGNLPRIEAKHFADRAAIGLQLRTIILDPLDRPLRRARPRRS